MSRYVADYTPVIRNLWKFEGNTRGDDRELLGYMALGIAKFLRCRSVIQDDRLEILALAEQAEQVGRICLDHPEPRGQA